MAHSREIRLPFLNHELVEFVFSLPSSFKIHHAWKKRILRTAMEDVLPKEIAWRKDKIGLDVPQKKWVQHPQIIAMVESAKTKLVKEKILVETASLDPWKLLMADRLMTETFK
jgi:asparagine synthase (glutamine-hydrolysing)